MTIREKIEAKDIRELVKSLARIEKKYEHSPEKILVLGFGRIENPDYQFDAWRADEGCQKDCIRSRLILYRPSLGLIDKKAVTTKGLELQTRYNLFSERMIHQFTESDLRDGWYNQSYNFELGKVGDDDFISFACDNLIELKKRHKKVISFTDPNSTFNLNWLPQDYRLLSLFSLETSVEGMFAKPSRKRSAVYEVLSAYSKQAIMNMEKKTKK